MDNLSKEERSKQMSRVRNKNTKPELLVRSLLHKAGYRFTVNGPKNKDLPGKPDLVLPKYKTALFVHGCFWHHHTCKIGRVPKSRVDFWQQKFERNAANDRKKQALLVELGWNVIVIWECELKDPDAALSKLLAELSRVVTHATPYPTAEEAKQRLAAEPRVKYLKPSNKRSNG